MDLYGPALPPGYVRPDDEDEEDSLDSSTKTTVTSPKIIGPQCPDFLTHTSKEEINIPVTDDNESLFIGPAIPPSLKVQSCGDDEDDLYGPMPSKCSRESSDILDMKVAIEKRAENMRNKLDDKQKPAVVVAEREEWMTVPDTSRRNQLGAISRCLAPEKQSKSSKVKHSHRHSEKDKKTTEELKKYNKSKRSESLLEMHKKHKKKKDKEKSTHKERKAFDRDEIATRNFSKDQVNSVIDKAKYLNSRFHAGSSKYL